MASRSFFASGESVGQYTVDGLLGPGRHAIAYRAHDAVGETCVLKVLTSPDAAVRDAFRDAAERGPGIVHGNVVGIRGWVESGETAALATEYVGGPSLRRWLEVYQPTPDEVLLIFRGILRGVDHLHACGVLHRALTPANVLLRPEASGLICKVADWGLYRSVDQLGLYGQRYLAPEVQQGRPADERSDLWSLGCVLHELSTGRAAWDADSTGELKVIVSESSPPRVDTDALGLPPAIDVALRALLQVDPKRRPSGTDELHEMLYGNTIVRRISQSRQADEADSAIIFASEVGLAVARSLGPGEGRGGEEVTAKAEHSVEHVASRHYRTPQHEQGVKDRASLVASGVFFAASLAMFALAVVAVVVALAL